MKLGIIAAESKEMHAIKHRLFNITEKSRYGITFYLGSWYGHEIYLVECGVGKVNAARTTQLLIDTFELDYIINVGSAGAVNPILNVKDVVIASSLIQYDFDATGIGNYQIGEICDTGRYFECDNQLVDMLNSKIESMEKDYHVCVGKIGTADYFCADHEKAAKIHKEFDVECVEMEGAAIAQVCFLNKVPFVVIRGISDTVNGNNQIDFHTYLELASEQVAAIIDELLKDWR